MAAEARQHVARQPPRVRNRTVWHSSGPRSGGIRDGPGSIRATRPSCPRRRCHVPVAPPRALLTGDVVLIRELTYQRAERHARVSARLPFVMPA